MSRIMNVSAAVLFVAAATLQADEPAKKSKPITPDAPIELFNGRNLNGWYTWLSDTKYEDPRQVFTVKNGLLHISGDGLGGLITNDEYTNYHLVTEWKWGAKTWGRREKAAKDSGILVHCIGEDGAHGGAWLTSIEAQVIQGGCGDFVMVTGGKQASSAPRIRLTAEVTRDRDGETVWHKGGKREVFIKGRVNWFGRDPDWKDEIGFRGPDEVEKPDGEWNRMEVICDGDRITNIVNGTVVNEATDVQPRAGKILIQTELAEIVFRKVELRPIERPQ